VIRRAGAFALAAVVVVAGAARAVAAAAPDPEALLARLDKNAPSVQTLAGAFTQTSRMKLFRQAIVSRGRFYFRRPRQVRWEYTEPDPSKMIIDGDRAVLTMPGAAPQQFDLARDPTMRAVADQIFLWLGVGSIMRARTDYAITAAGSDAAPVLVLTPKGEAPVGKAFARIELRFDAQLLLRSIILREPSGDEKQIDFSKMEKNAKLPADAFE
jgi:outer membrane lipoprotein carrier protein